MKITYATNYDDWKGIYVDGKLKLEGHSLRMDEVMALFSDFITYKEVDATDYLYEVGSLPSDLSELVNGN